MRGYVRLTLKPKRPGWPSKRRFSIVDLPEPEGPDMTMGCRDLGRLSSDSVGAIVAIVEYDKQQQRADIFSKQLKYFVVDPIEGARGVAKERVGVGFTVLANGRTPMCRDERAALTLTATIDSHPSA